MLRFGIMMVYPVCIAKGWYIMEDEVAVFGFLQTLSACQFLSRLVKLSIPLPVSSYPLLHGHLLPLRNFKHLELNFLFLFLYH